MNKKIKFSIIVPVYNTERYIEKCINSILNQTYKNYEVIIINDGSTDDSEFILEKYKNNKKINIIEEENKGLSGARNEGLNHITGDYILFIDSDDYIEQDLLETLNKTITNEDLIRFQAREVDENYKVINEYYEEEFCKLNTNEAIEKITNYHFIEASCFYCYKIDLFNKKNLKFKEGYKHEDFGLTPQIIINSKIISSINYIGYNYLQRNNSIMNDKNNERNKKKCFDFIGLGIENIKIIKNTNLEKKHLLLSYIANCILIKGKELDKCTRKEYHKMIKENNIDNYLLKDNLKRIIKILLYKLNYNLYLKVIEWI